MKNKILKKELWMKYHLNFPISGGYGESTKDAVIILLDNNLGILLEKDIIACMYYGGEYKFELIEQRLIKENGSTYDLIKIKLSNGEIREIYFDISAFFGKSYTLFKRDSKEYRDLILGMTIRPNSEEEMSWFD